MVESKSKSVLFFLAFLLPCLLLYILFFITPFFKGIGISLTNWDGLTPKAPISFSQTEFETAILGKLEKETDKEYLRSLYEFSRDEKMYHRRSLPGVQRRSVERIIGKTGYEPENNRFVGLDNYKKILTGKVDEDFYPHRYTQQKYSAASSLPLRISKKEFEKEILAYATSYDADLISRHYSFDAQSKEYVLLPEYDEFFIEDAIWLLPEVVDQQIILESDIDAFIADLNSSDNQEQVVTNFLQTHAVSIESEQTIRIAANQLQELGLVKTKLEETWKITKLHLGVVGFTLFFAFFSVVGINVLAFALALILDTGMKHRNIFRSIFFLPNVLSMVIVALIWSMVFVQLLPALTGIEKWISDSAKTPWLLVLVAIWQGCGYYMIVYLAGLQNIPTDIIEAATIDGASAFQRFKSITLPLLLPAITVSIFLSTANALKSFDLIYAMIGSTGYATGTIPFVMDIYFDAFAQKEAGMATAKAMLLFVAIFAVTGLQLFLMKRREVEQ